MYLALKHFRSRLPDGTIARLQPGDEVVGFDTWPARNQQAALATHMVRVRPAEGDFVGLENPPSIEDVRCWTFDAMREANRRQREAMGVTEQPQADEALPDSIVSPAPALDTLSCEHCDFQTESAQGLKTHYARKHRP